MLNKSSTRLGVDYYPEHWPESRWEEDARLMQKAQLTVVRLAEFAWSRLEPREGEFRFEWLDRALEVLASHGIQAVLGTPTASTPAWLVRKYPETVPIDENGHAMGFGTRLHRCYSSERYRERSRAVVEAMAKHFGDNNCVIGWQTDNEFSREDCICETCTAKWREWLRARYGSTDELNRAWGTVFWSQEYTNWSEVPPLARAKCGTSSHNPSLMLDWRRFQSGNAVSFQREQVEIIRRHSPGRFVTHNFMGYHDSLDYYDLAGDLDLVAWDNYPWDGPAGHAHDLMRGLKGKTFWVMEERSGHTGWNRFSPSPKPGQIRQWTWEAIGRGADAVVFFRWRSCLSGTEQFWQGILNHDAVPGWRYREVARTGAEISTLAKVLDESTVENSVAVFNDYENIWALDIQPQTDGFSFRAVQTAYAKAFDRLGTGCDSVGPDADFSRYRLVVFPPLFVLTDELARKISAYVEAGGMAVLNCRTGVKNRTNVCREERLPGPLAGIAGLEVGDYDAVGRQTVEIEMSDGTRFKTSTWCDVLDLKSALPLAMYRSNYYLGEPAVAVNRAGSGRAYYVGTVPEPAFHERFLREILDEIGVERTPSLPEGVEVARRSREGKPIQFVYNFTGETKEVPLTGKRRDLLSREKEEGALHLEPYGVRVYAV